MAFQSVVMGHATKLYSSQHIKLAVKEWEKTWREEKEREAS